MPKLQLLSGEELTDLVRPWVIAHDFFGNLPTCGPGALADLCLNQLGGRQRFPAEEKLGLLVVQTMSIQCRQKLHLDSQSSRQVFSFEVALLCL